MKNLTGIKRSKRDESTLENFVDINHLQMSLALIWDIKTPTSAWFDSTLRRIFSLRLQQHYLNPKHVCWYLNVVGRLCSEKQGSVLWTELWYSIKTTFFFEVVVVDFWVESRADYAVIADKIVRFSLLFITSYLC